MGLLDRSGVRLTHSSPCGSLKAAVGVTGLSLSPILQVGIEAIAPGFSDTSKGVFHDWCWVGHVARVRDTGMHTGLWWGNLRESDRLGDLGIDGRKC